MGRAHIKPRSVHRHATDRAPDHFPCRISHPSVQRHCHCLTSPIQISFGALFHAEYLDTLSSPSVVEVCEIGAECCLQKAVANLSRPQLSADWLFRKYVPRQRNASIDKTGKNARRWTKRAKKAHCCTNCPMCAATRPWWTPGGRFMQTQNRNTKHRFKDKYKCKYKRQCPRLGGHQVDQAGS